MNELGVDNFYIELIENHQCNDIYELRAREGFFIREISTLNKNIAGRTSKEYKEEHKEEAKTYKKQYYEKHKEEYKEAVRKYYEEHKEQKKEAIRKYYEEHKEEHV